MNWDISNIYNLELISNHPEQISERKILKIKNNIATPLYWLSKEYDILKDKAFQLTYMVREFITNKLIFLEPRNVWTMAFVCRDNHFCSIVTYSITSLVSSIALHPWVLVVRSQIWFGYGWLGRNNIIYINWGVVNIPGGKICTDATNPNVSTISSNYW